MGRNSGGLGLLNHGGCVGIRIWMGSASELLALGMTLPWVFWMSVF